MDRYEAKQLKKAASSSVRTSSDLLRPSLSPFKAYSAGPGFRFFTDGTLQQRCSSSTHSRARVHDLGHGQIEAVLQPVHDWVEIEPLSALALVDAIEQHHLSSVLTPFEQQELDDKNEDRSCRRARTKVRRYAKYKLLDTMITCTYVKNQQDRVLAQAHFAAFVRRVKRIIPGFEYVAVAETQKRGAWHWHIAVRQIKSGYWVSGRFVHSWALLRSIWRSVVAECGGNIDVKSPGKPGHSVAKLSSYLTKYITKGFGTGVKHQNRYQSSGRDLPASVVLELPTTGLAALAEVCSLLDIECSNGRLYTSPPLASGGYFLSVTPTS